MSRSYTSSPSCRLHGGEDVDVNVLSCNAVCICKYIPKFWGNIGLLSLHQEEIVCFAETFDNYLQAYCPFIIGVPVTIHGNTSDVSSFAVLESRWLVRINLWSLNHRPPPQLPIN
jgi:hypothetical protein